MPKKKKPGEKWFDRPEARCKLCGAGLTELEAAEKHFANDCSGLQAQRAGGKTEELQCFVAEDESQVFRLHFLARRTATFGDLDAALRSLWLECCGHCSQFAVLRRPEPNIIPQDPVAGVFFLGEEPQELCIISSMRPEGDDRDEWRPQESERLSARLAQPFFIAQHSYDFGTTTSTLIIAGAKISVPASAAARLFAGGQRLALVARNNMPQIPCCECGKPAQLVRNEGSNFSDKAYADFWCSQACARRSGAEFVDRLFNSPRSGVCGYEGPVEPEEGEEEPEGEKNSEEEEESSGEEEEGSEEGSSEGEEEQPAARGRGRGGAAGGRAKPAAKPAAAKKAAAKSAPARKAARKPAAASRPAAAKPAAAKPAAKGKAAAGKREAAAPAAGTRRKRATK